MVSQLDKPILVIGLGLIVNYKIKSICKYCVDSQLDKPILVLGLGLTLTLSNLYVNTVWLVS